MAEKSLAQLEAELASSKAELQEIMGLLAEDPANEDCLAIKADLVDLITQTETFITLKKKEKERKTATTVNTAAAIDLDHTFLSPLELAPSAAAPKAVVTTAKPVMPTGFFVGLECEAQWSGDGRWYTCLIQSLNDDGTIVVKFTGYGDEEKLPADKVRLMDLSAGARKKRKEPDAEKILDGQVPKNLQILPTDDEATRKAKKRRLKALKLKAKIQVAEEATSKKKASWKDFNEKSAKKRKVGAAASKESIFKSPDSVSGKVGVVGSGKAMTQSTSGPLIYKAKKLASGKIEQADLAQMAATYAVPTPVAVVPAGFNLPPGFSMPAGAVMSPWAVQQQTAPK